MLNWSSTTATQSICWGFKCIQTKDKQNNQPMKGGPETSAQLQVHILGKLNTERKSLICYSFNGPAIKSSWGFLLEKPYKKVKGTYSVPRSCTLKWSCVFLIEKGLFINQIWRKIHGLNLLCFHKNYFCFFFEPCKAVYDKQIMSCKLSNWRPEMRMVDGRLRKKPSYITHSLCISVTHQPGWIHWF